MRFRKSLDLAIEMQQSRLPRSDTRIEGLDIAGTSIYRDRTGGDYFLRPVDGRLRKTDGIGRRAGRG